MPYGIVGYYSGFHVIGLAKGELPVEWLQRCFKPSSFRVVGLFQSFMYRPMVETAARQLRWEISMLMSGVVPAVYIHIPTWVQNLVTWEEEDGYKISLFASELLSGPSGASQWISNTSEFNTIRVSESNIGLNLWVLAQEGYGVWVIADLWGFTC